MIRSVTEYRNVLKQLEQNAQVMTSQRAAFQGANFSPEEIERGLEPLLSFRAGLEEEVAWYESVQRHEFPPLIGLGDLGHLLIALRIANKISQRELAARLNVSEAQVSRDERNEYHGITVERAQRILEALHVRIVTRVEEPRELATA